VSDLQFSLLAIGVTIIGGVILYNWVQERIVRKRLDRAFAHAPEDALLPREPDVPDRATGEPHLGQASTRPQPPRAAHDAEPAIATARPARSVEHPEFDPALDYVGEIVAAAPIEQAALEELLTKVADCGRPARVLGLNAETGAWEEPARGGLPRYARLKLGLQLVNRSGAADAAQLSMFCDAARACAVRVAGRPACPDIEGPLKRARELDAFCSGVDVAIGINVIAPADGVFSGARIRELAESAGFTLEPDGVFHFRDEGRRTLFVLDNQDPVPFRAEQVRNLATKGITLVLEVPRVADGPAVLDRMIGIGRELAVALGGSLADDNRVALSEAGIARIRDQVRSIHAALAARDIPPGGARALRLFS
jgi:hypothetical protein